MVMVPEGNTERGWATHATTIEQEKKIQELEQQLHALKKRTRSQQRLKVQNDFLRHRLHEVR